MCFYLFRLRKFTYPSYIILLYFLFYLFIIFFCIDETRFLYFTEFEIVVLCFL